MCYEVFGSFLWVEGVNVGGGDHVHGDFCAFDSWHVAGAGGRARTPASRSKPRISSKQATGRKTMLIFEPSQFGRRNPSQAPLARSEVQDIPANLRRGKRPLLPEVSEMQTVRHYTRLSQQNFSIHTQFYPLGSWAKTVEPARR